MAGGKAFAIRGRRCKVSSGKHVTYQSEVLKGHVSRVLTRTKVVGPGGNEASGADAVGYVVIIVSVS